MCLRVTFQKSILKVCSVFNHSISSNGAIFNPESKALPFLLVKPRASAFTMKVRYKPIKPHAPRRLMYSRNCGS